MTKLLLLQGANMVWLGKREPVHYGTTTAAELDSILQSGARERGVELDIRYTNIEGEAIDTIYAATARGIDGLLMNPAGFSHAGFALRDCLKAVRPLPYIEIHMTNTAKRGIEPVTTAEAVGVIAGFGTDSYILALDAMLRHLERNRRSEGSIA